MSNRPRTAPSPARMLISACLLGNPVRYDGRSKPIDDSELCALQQSGRLVAFCPEMAGGLPVPRVPAEIIGGDGDAVLDGQAFVRTELGEDVSRHFIEGAERALALCQREGIRIAVLTERSPSCGSSEIYDGDFRKRTIDASGVTSALLRRHGFSVYSQFQLAEAVKQLNAD